jgi:type I restriction-modification system DNA methylase subunit
VAKKSNSAPNPTKTANSGARFGFEAELWLAAKKQYGHMDDAMDALGRVDEYLLGRFAGTKRKKGWQFYTPRILMRLKFELLSTEHIWPCRGEWLL